jgi:CRISPR/Cas system-associated exonuclease Cas4 (RecB family)
MKLTEQQLFDYMYCPVKYYLKYKSKIVVQEEITVNKLLTQITKYFYNSVANGKLPTLKQMQSKLDSLCEANREIVTPKKSIEMWGQVYNFYNWACDNQIAVIDTDTKYAITLGEHIVEGTMSPIALTQGNKLELLIINFSSRVPDQLEIDTKTKYTLDTLAFNRANKDMRIDATHIHLLKQNKDMYTTRNNNDYERLNSTVNNIAKSIQNELYYPKETHMCTSCNYRNYCRAWK